MKLVLNGDVTHVEATTIAELVDELGLGDTRVAVELNRTIVRRAAWPETTLKESDAVEIVHFVGGG